MALSFLSQLGGLAGRNQLGGPRSDGRVEEAAGALLAFTVTLTRAVGVEREVLVQGMPSSERGLDPEKVGRSISVIVRRG